MARRLRIQYKGAIYHVINRGNYRSDVFGSVGAAQAFESVLAETCETWQWRLHAYVIMRNHFHLTIETPQPNLVDGMHWLQSTYATRFNRFRSECGHLFQGRYQALLIENFAAVARVVNYIHLNPLRAHLVEPAQLAQFRWSSLARFTREGRPAWLVAEDWLQQLGLADSRDGWQAYEKLLLSIAGTTDADAERQALCHGWAIGIAGWRQAVAKDYAHLALGQGIAANEARELKHAHWAATLERELERIGKTSDDCASDSKSAGWKLELAIKLRDESGAADGWIAENLQMGSPSSVRSHVSRGRRSRNQQTSAFSERARSSI